MTDLSLLDEVNRRIIGRLQQDGRTSYAALAKTVGLSEAAVRQRVQRLLDAGVMRIVAVTDPSALGLARQVLVGVRTTGDPRVVADQLATFPEVDQVVICAGPHDLLAEVACVDDEDLLRLLTVQIRTIPGVTNTETFIYLKRVKGEHARISHP